MALLGNYSTALKTPIRRFGGTASESGMRPAFGGNGALRGRQFQDGSTTADRFQSLPSASYPQVAYMLPQKGQWISSRFDANISFTASATGVQGMPGTGSASFSITTNTPDGQLLASGTGTASFSIATGTSALTASLNGTGTAAFAVSVATTQLDAQASIIGSAAISFSGSLSPHARANLSAAILPYTDLSPEALALAVWNGLPLEGTLSAADIQRVVLSAMAGKATGGGGSTITFRDQADTKDRITAAVDGTGNRSSVTLNPS